MTKYDENLISKIALIGHCFWGNVRIVSFDDELTLLDNNGVLSASRFYYGFDVKISSQSYYRDFINLYGIYMYFNEI